MAKMYINRIFQIQTFINPSWYFYAINFEFYYINESSWPGVAHQGNSLRGFWGQYNFVRVQILKYLTVQEGNDNVFDVNEKMEEIFNVEKPSTSYIEKHEMMLEFESKVARLN